MKLHNTENTFNNLNEQTNQRTTGILDNNNNQSNILSRFLGYKMMNSNDVHSKGLQYPVNYDETLADNIATYDDIKLHVDNANTHKFDLGGIPWKQFNAQQYIDATRVKPGEDRYRKNKFNQEASDSLDCDRVVPDTRNIRYLNDLVCNKKNILCVAISCLNMYTLFIINKMLLLHFHIFIHLYDFHIYVLIFFL